MAKNTVLLSVRVLPETKDKLTELCNKLELQLGFQPTQAQALDFALKYALGVDLSPKTKRAPAKPQKQPDAPKVQPENMPDETDAHKLDLKSRYAQSCVALVLDDESAGWTAIPFRYLYEIYKLWLPNSEDPYKDEPLNLNQFIAAIRGGYNNYLVQPYFEPWHIEETGDNMSKLTDGTGPLVQKYGLEDWIQTNQEVFRNFQGFVKN